MDGAGGQGLSDCGGQPEPLKDEIYRVCYLMTQAGGSAVGYWRQSGLSKQRDFSITQEVLRAYGDAVKETMKQVLRAIAGGAAGRA